MSKRANVDPLKKELGLGDVFAISTGAMISSGFFLLPGLAAAKTGPSVVLAYALAGVLILPALFSKAELSTAMPRAGGTYYFLDRSLGPMLGTVGGLGTFLALVLKTAFALIGIGAYLTIYVDLPIKPVAIAIAVAFMGLNIIGAKETSNLQRILVIILISVLTFFLAQGVWAIFFQDVQDTPATTSVPFLSFGLEGLLSTVGFVFVSYAGLTKVASVAEEVKNPDRNIPLGMILSLASTTIIYIVGVYIMVAVLKSDVLYSDLSPVATAGEVFFDWPSRAIGLLLIVVAATAAFASTGNAGLLSASRYPFAMARDRLVPDVFARLGRFRTPAPAILITTGLIILFIIVLDEEGIAKLASAFQLFIFMLVNFAVIVMRESKITAYDPGFSSPFYPWIQLFGMVISVILIVAMGWLAILFTLGLVALCLIWYHYYARKRVVRDGAIYHWFASLGQRIYRDLDVELRAILKEKGLREADPFEEIVADAAVLDVGKKGGTLESLIEAVSRIVEEQLPALADEVKTRLHQGLRMGLMPIAKGVCLPHLHIPGIKQPILFIVRSRKGIVMNVVDIHGKLVPEEPIYAFFFLISPEEDARQHLRILAQIARRVDADDFMQQWCVAENEQALKEILLRDERFLSIRLKKGTPSEKLIGKALREIRIPKGSLIVLVFRDGSTFVPDGNTVLQDRDRLTIIGDPGGIGTLYRQYGIGGEVHSRNLEYS